MTSASPASEASAVSHAIAVPSTASRVTREILASVVFGATLPYALFMLLRPRFGEIPSLLVGGIPAALWEVISLLRHRRLDPLASLNLAALALSVVLAFSSGDARLILLKESF